MLLLRSLVPALLMLSLEQLLFGQDRIMPITNCQDVLQLSPEQSREHRPVRLRGSVTCFVPSGQLFFIQDASGGVYVYPAPWPKELKFGEIVEFEGTTAEGRFSSIAEVGFIRRTGETANVTPQRISIEELNTGRFDCQFVEIEGVVQNATFGRHLADLKIATGGNVATVLVFGEVAGSTNWIDARVKVRGVGGTFYSDSQLAGFGLFAHEASFLNVIKPSPAPFSVPLRTTRKPVWFSREGARDHRARFHGTVSLVWTNEAFFMRDEFGPLRISSWFGGTPNEGDIIDVSGFIRNALDQTPELVSAVWRKTGSVALKAPNVSQLSDLLGTRAQGQLASTEGKVIGMHKNGDLTILTIEDDGQLLTAFTRGPVRNDTLRTEAKFTGAFSSAPAKVTNAPATGLWLQSSNGLVVLRRAAEASPPRNKTDFVLGGTVVAVLISAALVWKARQREKVASTDAQSTAVRLDLAESQLDQLKAARERLGRDLHDHIIQSIYGVGLKLEDFRQTLADPKKTDSRLQTSLSEINDVIRELRNVILGIETNTIQPQEFRTALKSLGLTLGHEKSNRMRLEIDQTAVDMLTPTQTTELIHIAREAMSNSVRHGHSQTTTFSLHTLENRIRFSVEDDGRGFNPNAPEPKGYGLRNMAKRADSLGAKFTIRTEQGGGTRIVLDIPRQKQHFSA